MPAHLTRDELKTMTEDRTNHFAFHGFFSDSLCKACNPTGPEIIPGVRAFKELKDIDISSSDSYAIGSWAYGYHGASPGFFTKIKDVNIKSIQNEPLTLDESASDYSQVEKKSVYTGNLTISWKEVQIKIKAVRWPIFPIRVIYEPRDVFKFPRIKIVGREVTEVDKSSKLKIDNFTLQFRVDSRDDLLYCYQSNDRDYVKKLICVHVEGTLENPAVNIFDLMSFLCKSKEPMPDQSPADFHIRRAQIWIY